MVTGREVAEIVISGGKACGVKVKRTGGEGSCPAYYAMPGLEEIASDKIAAALPIYQLPAVMDFSPSTSLMLGWWLKGIGDIMHEVTCLIGFMLGFSEPVTDKPCFFSALSTSHASFPFQAFPVSNFDPGVVPAGKQLLHTDMVCEYPTLPTPSAAGVSLTCYGETSRRCSRASARCGMEDPVLRGWLRWPGPQALADRGVQAQAAGLGGG